MGLEPPRVIGRASKPLCCCLSATKGLSSDDGQDCCRDLGLGRWSGLQSRAANCIAGSAKANQEEKAELVKWIKQVYC